MKKIIAGLIGGVFFAGLFLGTAAASGDDDYYEHGGYGEYGEHGRYYGNPYYSNGNARVYNNGYRNHERYEYDDDDYRYRGTGRVYVNPYYNSSYGSGYSNNGYRNHEGYEHGGYRR
jgi:hypothetical protein